MIEQWHRQGLFIGHDDELAEALTCACFLGEQQTAEYLLSQGVPLGGAKTGFDALHWAVNRGHAEVVRLLIGHSAPMDSISMYGGTVLDTGIWSVLNEPRPGQLEAIELLLQAGVRASEHVNETGNQSLEALIRSYRDKA